MGQAMAARVLEAGHELTVYTRSRDKGQSLVDRGAQRAESPAAAARAELVVTMLSDDAALEHVLGQGGALAAMTTNTVHVSMSTISQALALKLTATHAERALARCQPLFDVLSQKVLALGAEPAAAHLAKVLGNFMLISSVELLAEALNVAKAAGMDPQALLQALTGSVFSAPFYASYGRTMLAQDFSGPPAFALPLARKDVALAVAAAASVSAPLPSAEPVRAKIGQLIAAGGEQLDLTALGKWT
jgi:3-hydroxyisobutyrate dehydrogenase-like beta-hydroxyacid dehydrogenase